MDIMMKLVALGDSIMKGVLLTKEDNGALHYALSDRSIADYMAEKLQTEVINLGKMGCTVQIGENILNRHIEHLDGAKYVIMCYGGNDSDYDWRAIADSPQEEHLPRTPLRVFEKTYTRIINKVRDMGFVPVVLSLPPIDSQSYFDFITASFTTQQKNNVFTWLKGSVDTIWAGHELYNDAVKRVAASADVKWIDLSSGFIRRQNFLCHDGIHPNLYGYRLIANTIASAL